MGGRDRRAWVGGKNGGMRFSPFLEGIGSLSMGVKWWRSGSAKSLGYGIGKVLLHMGIHEYENGTSISILI